MRLVSFQRPPLVGLVVLWMMMIGTISFGSVHAFSPRIPTTTTTTTRADARKPCLWQSTTAPSDTTATTTFSNDDDNNNNDSKDPNGLTLAERTRPDFEILQVHPLDQDPTTTTVTTNGDQESSSSSPPLIYLDSAATSQKPRVVLEAMDRYYRTYNSNVHRGAHTLSRQATAAYEAARDAVAGFVHANCREEIVFTSGATEALNLIVQSHGRHRQLGPGNEVLLTVAEHHANLVPWQLLAQEKGFTIKFVPLKEPEPTSSANPLSRQLDWSQLDNLLTERTKIVSFQHVSNVLATVNPVQDIVGLIRQKCGPDVTIALDACQSVPHMPVNVQELGIDFLVASGHKLCAPTGIGFLWGRQDLLNAMPPYKGGGEMIHLVTLEGSTYLPSPSRFEAGTPPIAPAIGLAAAIQYLNDIGGMKAIEDYESQLAVYLYQQLSQVPGISILGPPPPPPSLEPQDSSSSSSTRPLAGHRAAALTAFCHESIHPSDLSALLDTHGVAVRAGHHCCQPLHQALGISHSIRASLAFYNTYEYVSLVVVVVGREDSVS